MKILRYPLVVCLVVSLTSCASNRKLSPKVVATTTESRRADDRNERFKELLLSLRSLDDPGFRRTYFALLSNFQTLQLPPLPGLSRTHSPVPAPVEALTALNLFTVEVDPRLKDLVSEDLLKTRYDMPVVLNSRVLRFLNYYQNRRRDVMQRGLKRSGKYLKLFRKIFKKEGIPQDLVYMAHTESLFNPHAYSRARAKGIWQFIKWTGLKQGLRQDWWIDERSDIAKSTEAAARYLKELHGLLGDWHLALAAYNVGPARIQRIIRRHGVKDYWSMVRRRLLPRETRNYVPSILASLIIFRNPERYGFQVEPDPEIEFETVTLDYQVDLGVVSESIGVPIAQIAALNPELTRGVTPREYPDYALKVPPGKAELLKTYLANLPPEKRLTLLRHRVRNGETLSVIASKYSVPLRAIAQVNRIRNIHRIRARQDLIIPVSGRPGTRMAMTQRFRPGRSRRIVDLSGNYMVRRGDSLGKIAHLYRVTVTELRQWNNLKPGAFIYPGQKLIALNPSARNAYVVKRGDSLGKIARRHGVTVRELRQWNNLRPGAFIHPGQTVRILAKAAKAAN